MWVLTGVFKREGPIPWGRPFFFAPGNEIMFAMESPELPTLSYATPAPDHGRVRVGRLVAWVVTAGLLGTVPGVLLAYQNIRTIMVTGPLLLLMGVIAMVLCLLGRALWALPACAMLVLFPILVFLIINVFNLGPDAAEVPVLIMSLVFIMLLIPATALAWYRRPSKGRAAG